jgi:hypothetical protein
LKLETVKAVFHNQYNTPIGMYSDSNVYQEFQNQTKGIMPEPINHQQQQQQQQYDYEQNYHQQHQHQQQQQYQSQSSLQQQRMPKGAGSMSMRMLNSGIEHSQGANQQPPSVFDLKGGHNPTGATVPRGFRTVQAPVNFFFFNLILYSILQFQNNFHFK